MDNDKYIVAPNRSISTKVGIKGPQQEVTEKIIGSNWQTLIKKGWIIKEEKVKFKNEVEKIEANLAKPEKKKPTAKKKTKKVVKKKTENNSKPTGSNFGAQKKKEETENNQDKK